MNALSTQTENSWLVPNEKLKGLTYTDHLFNKLDILYPGKWRNQFPTDGYLKDCKQAWGEELHERGITLMEVKAGLDSCIKKHKDWPPNFPQFLECCKPEIDYEAAFLEAVEQMRLREKGLDKWSHCAVYCAAVRFGCDINNFPYLSIKTRWKVAVDDSKAKIEAGELPGTVPERLTALPSPESAHTTPKAEGLRILAEMKRVLESKIVR
jgi:hypothetical protein